MRRITIHINLASTGASTPEDYSTLSWRISLPSLEKKSPFNLNKTTKPISYRPTEKSQRSIQLQKYVCHLGPVKRIFFKKEKGEGRERRREGQAKGYCFLSSLNNTIICLSSEFKIQRSQNICERSGVSPSLKPSSGLLNTQPSLKMTQG